MPNEVLLCIPVFESVPFLHWTKQKVAEHLQPGESYKEAACRGLKEELGVHVSPSSNRLRLFCPARPHVYTNDTKGIRDFEFQECYLVSSPRKDETNCVDSSSAGERECVCETARDIVCVCGGGWERRRRSLEDILLDNYELLTYLHVTDAFPSWNMMVSYRRTMLKLMHLPLNLRKNSFKCLTAILFNSHLGLSIYFLSLAQSFPSLVSSPCRLTLVGFAVFVFFCKAKADSTIPANVIEHETPIANA